MLSYIDDTEDLRERYAYMRKGQTASMNNVSTGSDICRGFAKFYSLSIFVRVLIFAMIYSLSVFVGVLISAKFYSLSIFIRLLISIRRA